VIIIETTKVRKIGDTQLIEGINPKEIMSANIDVDFKELFNNIDYLIEKGKGYSIFNVNDDIFHKFKSAFDEAVKTKYKVITFAIVGNINMMVTQETELTVGIPSKNNIPIIIYDNLDFELSLNNVNSLVKDIIYPAWFKNCSIFFLSKLDKSAYNVNKIQPSLIHTNYSRVTDLLALEQMNNLLELVNVTITSPNMITDYDDNVLYTPIEKIFKDKLIERNISFKPQVRVGRFYVDFMVEVNNSKVIVECDGKGYHDPDRDKERDKELSREGYRIFRFSGSRLYKDCDGCLNEILKNTDCVSNKTYPLEELNDEQIVAVKHIRGPMRVLAPAGSGKTKTLVNRIINLVNNGVPENEILALAFNKAAKTQMSERLNENHRISNVHIKTFHSFGNEIVKQSLKWRFNGDTQECITRVLLEEVVSNHEEIVYQRNKDSMDEYLSMLSKVKNELLHTDEMLLEVDNKSVNFESIFNDYIKKMREHSFYNFDDMIYIAVRQLLINYTLRRKMQNRYKYILVDEFQDLNRVQLLMLEMLSLPENNLFIVGDDDQMIYSFRGAEVKHILDFSKKYPINEEQVLKVNYRSCSDIVKHSKWLIDNNKIRATKDITPFSSKEGDISLFVGISLKDQAEKIASWILEHKDTNTKWSDFAVLYRYNQYSDILYMILSKYNIPVKFDGIKVLDSSVGKCLLSYLTIIYDKENSKPQHYEDILKRPNKYLKNEFIKSIKNFSDFNDIEMAKSKLSEITIHRYINLVSKINNLSINIKNKTASNVMTDIVEEFELKQFYKDQSKSSAEIDTATDYDILEIILSFAESFETVEQFYNYYINPIKEKDKDSNDENSKDKVDLTSIHRTKGNEYGHVAYYNLTSRITERATEDVLEEERRVAYVGVTRPRKSLIVTSVRNEISPFIKEFFLNPKYKGLQDSELRNKINDINSNAVTNDAYLKCLEIQTKTLVAKYPELKGKATKVTGWFKGIRQSLRQVDVDKALKEYNKFNSEKVAILKSNSNIANATSDIEIELNYRNKMQI
jgi:DNA helicase-2/ATP-dependent DNA helicase PcrA